jgi:hypothetical protein
MIWVRREVMSIVGAVTGQKAARNAPYKRL